MATNALNWILDIASDMVTLSASSVGWNTTDKFAVVDLVVFAFDVAIDILVYVGIFWYRKVRLFHNMSIFFYKTKKQPVI